jgi:hypothetical protein
VRSRAAEAGASAVRPAAKPPATPDVLASGPWSRCGSNVSNLIGAKAAA